MVLLGPVGESSKSTILKTLIEGFPGSLMVKNPPANAEDTGLIPGLGRFCMPRGSRARVPTTIEPVC